MKRLRACVDLSGVTTKLPRSLRQTYRQTINPRVTFGDSFVNTYGTSAPAYQTPQVATMTPPSTTPVTTVTMPKLNIPVATVDDSNNQFSQQNMIAASNVDHAQQKALEAAGLPSGNAYLLLRGVVPSVALKDVQLTAKIEQALALQRKYADQVEVLVSGGMPRWKAMIVAHTTTTGAPAAVAPQAITPTTTTTPAATATIPVATKATPTAVPVAPAPVVLVPKPITPSVLATPKQPATVIPVYDARVDIPDLPTTAPATVTTAAPASLNRTHLVYAAIGAAALYFMFVRKD